MVEFRLENAFSRFGLEFRIVMGTMGISNTDQILNSFRRVIRANTIETKRQWNRKSLSAGDREVEVVSESNRRFLR